MKTMSSLGIITAAVVTVGLLSLGGTSLIANALDSQGNGIHTSPNGGRIYCYPTTSDPFWDCVPVVEDFASGDVA
jgi:hypothetical protein